MPKRRVRPSHHRSVVVVRVRSDRNQPNAGNARPMPTCASNPHRWMNVPPFYVSVVSWHPILHPHWYDEQYCCHYYYYYYYFDQHLAVVGMTPFVVYWNISCTNPVPFYSSVHQNVRHVLVNVPQLNCGRSNFPSHHLFYYYPPSWCRCRWCRSPHPPHCDRRRPHRPSMMVVRSSLRPRHCASHPTCDRHSILPDVISVNHRYQSHIWVDTPMYRTPPRPGITIRYSIPIGTGRVWWPFPP